MPREISPETQRRFLMALQGLYPGRRWSGKSDIVPAIRTMGGLQVDPLNVVARSHDIAMWGRVDGYRMADLDALLYTERLLFDWGGVLFIMPMDELPYWRVVMERRKSLGRTREFSSVHAETMRDVLTQIRDNGPMKSADFGGGIGIVNTGFRNAKATGQALFHLWLTGELMTHSRRGFQRVYDLTGRVAPPEHQAVASEGEAEDYFARLLWRQYGMVRAKAWQTAFRYAIERPVSAAEAEGRLNTMLRAGEIFPVTIKTRKDLYYARAEDEPLLDAIERGGLPDGWTMYGNSTSDEAVILAPLEMISARGRSKLLFDFEYIWEVYKPAEKRRWGYYTMPILYGDDLVARLDPKLDRASRTLHVKGLWLEPEMRTDDADFSAAMARGLANFARFVGADRIDVSAVQPDPLRAWAATVAEAAG